MFRGPLKDGRQWIRARVALAGSRGFSTWLADAGGTPAVTSHEATTMMFLDADDDGA